MFRHFCYMYMLRLSVFVCQDFANAFPACVWHSLVVCVYTGHLVGKTDSASL